MVPSTASEMFFEEVRDAFPKRVSIARLPALAFFSKGSPEEYVQSSAWGVKAKGGDQQAKTSYFLALWA